MDPAAATVLAFAGDASLRTGAAELAWRGREVVRAADELGVPCDDLVEAASALYHADDATRLQAVLALDKAATALEVSAEALQGALRRGAEDLARARKSRGLACPDKHYLDLAREICLAAEGLEVRQDALRLAGRALLRASADDDTRAQAIAVLDREATALERAAGARLAVLGCSAASLAMACQDYIWASENMPALRRAAEVARARRGAGSQLSARASGAKQEDERSGAVTPPGRRGGRPTAGAWWPFRPFLGRRQATSREDLEALLPESDSSPQPASADETNLDGTQGQELRSASQSFAIFGSLTMLPYLGPEGVLKPASAPFRKWVHVVFCIYWTLLAVGVRCNFTKSKIKLMYAQISSDMGMLGVNALVILFSSCLLAPGDAISFWLLGMAACLHLCSFIW